MIQAGWPSMVAVSVFVATVVSVAGGLFLQAAKTRRISPREKFFTDMAVGFGPEVNENVLMLHIASGPVWQSLITFGP